MGGIFLQENFPNSAFEPYLLDQVLLNSKLVGDFQTFDWISQWQELHRVSSGFIVFHQHFIMFHPPESQQQTIQPAVLLQDHLFVLVLIEAALGKMGNSTQIFMSKAASLNVMSFSRFCHF